MKCGNLRRMLALWNVPTRGPSWLYAARFRQLSPRPHQVLVAWISVYYLSGNMSSILIWFSMYSTKPDSLVEFCWTRKILSSGDIMEDEWFSVKIAVVLLRKYCFYVFFTMLHIHSHWITSFFTGMFTEISDMISIHLDNSIVEVSLYLHTVHVSVF